MSEPELVRRVSVTVERYDGTVARYESTNGTEASETVDGEPVFEPWRARTLTLTYMSRRDGYVVCPSCGDPMYADGPNRCPAE